MAKAAKPTKQQIAQAKARAGGNNPVKVTNADLKKLGNAALIAASFTPVGRAARGAATTVKAISKVRAGGVGREGAGKIATKIGDKLSGASSKKVQKKLEDIARKDWKDTLERNPDMTGPDAWSWSTHPAMASRKGFDRAVTKRKTVTNRQTVRYRKAEDKQAEKANARGLKAANKPVSKNNRNIGGPVVRNIIKNSPPARANRTRAGNPAKKK